jgi:hypothetical protein
MNENDYSVQDEPLIIDRASVDELKKAISSLKSLLQYFLMDLKSGEKHTFNEIDSEYHNF